jgi:hypothetical protein
VVKSLYVQDRATAVAIQARRRESGAFDILLLEPMPNSNAGNYYHANAYGELTKAMYLGERTAAVSDAGERFHDALDFWMKYRYESLEHASARH